MITRSALFSLLMACWILLLPACNPAVEPTSSLLATPSAEPTAVAIEPTIALPTQASPADLPIPSTATPEAGESIEADKNVLVLIEGTARLSRDHGNSWTATGTGQWLETGDELQLSEDGLALIFFFSGAVLRLEGPSDFELVLSESDAESGATQLIGRLWQGYALFETNPLPTPDSIFQLLVMTSFIDVEYDEELAAKTGNSTDLDPDLSIIAGGLLDEENEMLFHFRGPAALYVLDLDPEGGDTIAGGFFPGEQELTTLEIAFFEDVMDEIALESFAPIAAHLIHQYQHAGIMAEKGLLGYVLSEVEPLDGGQILYFFEDQSLSAISAPGRAYAKSLSQPHSALVMLAAQSSPMLVSDTQQQSTYLGRVTRYTTRELLFAARNPQATNTEVKILYGNKKGFGCNPYSGYGCPAPAGCDQASGKKCTLSTGCNVVTKEGCRMTTITCQKYGKYNSDGHLIGSKLVCPASKQPGCNPNIAGDCARFYDPDAWKNFEEDDDEAEWCWCRAKVPKGWPPPPPWMDMYYRCWCSDPGAVRIKP